jgi:hypothetical protein
MSKTKKDLEQLEEIAQQLEKLDETEEETKAETQEELTEKSLEKEQSVFDPNKDLKCGFLVGIKNNEKEDYLFEVFGTDVSVINLMGVKEYANQMVGVIKDKSLKCGGWLTNETFKLLLQLNQKLDNVLTELNRPTNKL